MQKLKFILLFILFGIIGKANIPAVKYFEQHNKLHSAVTKSNSNSSIWEDFLYEESFEEEEDETENENNSDSQNNFSTSLYYSTPNFLASNVLVFAKNKIAKRSKSKKQFVSNSLYIAFSNFRI